MALLSALRLSRNGSYIGGFRGTSAGVENVTRFLVSFYAVKLDALQIGPTFGIQDPSQSYTNIVPLARLLKQSSCLVSKSALPTVGVVQRKNFALTRVANKRIYAPEEDHEKIDDKQHWINERYVAVLLIPAIPTALIYPNLITDSVLVTAMCLHTYWRLSGVCEDYIHEPILQKLAQPAVKILFAVALGSLCYFNYFDIGFAEAARQIYTEL